MFPWKGEQFLWSDNFIGLLQADFRKFMILHQHPKMVFKYSMPRGMELI